MGATIYIVGLKNLERPLADLQKEAKKVMAEADRMIANNGYNGRDVRQLEHAKEVKAFCKKLLDLNMDEDIDAEWDKRGFSPAFTKEKPGEHERVPFDNFGGNY